MMDFGKINWWKETILIDQKWRKKKEKKIIKTRKTNLMFFSMSPLPLHPFSFPLPPSPPWPLLHNPHCIPLKSLTLRTNRAPPPFHGRLPSPPPSSPASACCLVAAGRPASPLHGLRAALLTRAQHRVVARAMALPSVGRGASRLPVAP
jgi:hypothetical protein